MSQELKANDSTRIEHIGRSGIYPPSGPYPPGDFQFADRVHWRILKSM